MVGLALNLATRAFFASAECAWRSAKLPSFGGFMVAAS